MLKLVQQNAAQLLISFVQIKSRLSSHIGLRVVVDLNQSAVRIQMAAKTKINAHTHSLTYDSQKPDRDRNSTFF